MKTISEQFAESVEGFLTDTGMDPTNFGKSALKDPKFVFDLRKGRSPSARTMDRVLAFISGQRPSESPESQTNRG